MGGYQPGETGGSSPGPARSNGFLYFAVGALVVAVGGLGFMYYQSQNQPESAIERSADAIGDAAEDISDSVRDAARDIPPPSTPAPAPAAPTVPPG